MKFAALREPFRHYAEALFREAQRLGLQPRVTSTYRSYQEQARLYRAYQRGNHPYPVLPPGSSLHNYGLAIDLVSDDNPRLGAIWRSWGGSWGGSSDPIHFEWPSGT